MSGIPLQGLAEGAVDSEALDEAIRTALGYRVVGPEGDIGAVVGVPEAGRPLRPLVLVVRDENTMRFVPLQRVAAVLPTARRLLLGPEMGPSPDGRLGSPRGRSASRGPASERSST